MEENFCMEWNTRMERKIFSMEWKWNRRKLPVWNMEKSSFIPFQTIHWLYARSWINKTFGKSLEKWPGKLLKQ